MEFEYKATVIIPVYNVEKYLPACLDSLLDQTIPQEEMEVLMINDGSPDGSLEICERYAAEHENFKVISQENQGVSAARNTGIRNAKGKYLFYLDGDDTFSRGVVKNVSSFFDKKYDEVDVVGYPIRFCYADGRKVPHGRDKILKTTRVYDVEKTLNINLTTINAAIKNKGEDNFLFDEGLFYHEDEAYLATAVMSCGKFGYVRDAIYYYMKRGEGVSDKLVNPYYIFEPSIALYEQMFEKYRTDEGVSKYIQTIVLNDFGWKIRDDALFPYHYSEEKFEKAVERISELLNQIDAELILRHPSMNEAHKYYLLSIKTENRPDIQILRDHKNAKNEILMSDKTGWINRNDKIWLVVSRCKMEGDTFYLLAYLKDFAFDYTEKPLLFAIIDGETRVELPLFLSQHSCFWSLMKTNTFWRFSIEIPATNFKSLRFEVELMGQKFECRYYFGDRQGLQPSRKRNYIEGENYGIFFQANKFLTVPLEGEKFRNAKKLYEKFLFHNKFKQWLVRRYAHKQSKHVIWLYEDIYNAVDNAYYQFQHDFDKQDGIERYYICDKQNLDWQDKFTSKQQRYLVERRGRKHKKLFIQADKILTSFSSINDFVPFDRDTILWYWDLFRFEVVYLQHGVMHAELPNMYSKEKVYMVDKVVVSTYFERENLINRLAYREKDVLCTGMPRLDNLHRKEKQRKLLFAPSWRSYLVFTDAEGKRFAIPDFEQSDYFREVSGFLTDPRLNKMLEEKDYTIEIKLHPNFEAYTKLFEDWCQGRISLVEEVELGEYSACITDFTSFMYDFLYMDIPVFTHIFDAERFYAGLHTYRQLCWPMETEYPYYCKDIETLLTELNRLMEDPEKVANEFADFTKDMFFSREENHAESVYQCLMMADEKAKSSAD